MPLLPKKLYIMWLNSIQYKKKCEVLISMDNKQLIIIVVAIIVAGCIVAGAVLFASSNVETVNTTVANNTTNSSLANNTTGEVVSDGSGQSSQSNNHAQSSYRSSSYQDEPFEEGYGTDEYYASHGFKQDSQGGWTDQYGNPAA